MNVKQYLKQQAKNDHREILSADDGEVLRSLQKRIGEAPKKRRHTPRLKALIGGVAGALAAVTAITCMIVYLPNNDSVVYWEENFKAFDSDFESLNGSLSEFSIVVDPLLYSSDVIKTIDSVSGDVLFYKANITSLSTLVRFEIIAVCNERYLYKGFHKTEEFLDVALPQYTVAYHTTITSDPDFGINMLNGLAEIKIKNENIYVMNYSELMLDEHGSFLDIIQKTVLTKQTREADLSPIAKN